jgi:hypothetical protein
MNDDVETGQYGEESSDYSPEEDLLLLTTLLAQTAHQKQPQNQTKQQSNITEKSTEKSNNNNNKRVLSAMVQRDREGFDRLEKDNSDLLRNLEKWREECLELRQEVDRRRAQVGRLEELVALARRGRDNFIKRCSCGAATGNAKNASSKRQQDLPPPPQPPQPQHNQQGSLVAALRAELAEGYETIGRLRAACAGAGALARDLEVAQRERDTAVGRMISLEKDVLELTRTRAEARAETAAVQHEMQRRISELNARAEALTERAEAAEALAQPLHAATRECETLRARLAVVEGRQAVELEAALADNRRLASERRELLASVDTAGKLLAEAERRDTGARRALVDLQGELSTLRAERDQAGELLEAASSARDSLAVEVSQLRAEVAHLRAALSAAEQSRKAYDTIAERVRDAESRAEEAAARARDSAAECQVLSSALAAAEAGQRAQQQRALKAEEALDSEREVARQARQRYQADLDRLRKDCQSLERRLARHQEPPPPPTPPPQQPKPAPAAAHNPEQEKVLRRLQLRAVELEGSLIEAEARADEARAEAHSLRQAMAMAQSELQLSAQTVKELNRRLHEEQRK